MVLAGINIDELSSVPKYIQVTESIINLVEKGELKLGEKLPSINEAYQKLGISRDTLINAYDELKSRGVIAPRHGKGFYIANVNTPRHLKIFVLFDVMNGYKAILYRHLVKHLGENCSVDIYFHHYNIKLFESLIDNNLGNYEYYVVMPHFNVDVSEIVAKIPVDRLLLIDKDVSNLSSKYAAVFQDFEKDIYESLKSGLKLLSKYKRLFMVTTTEFQFIPDGLVEGFLHFSKEFRFESGFVSDISNHPIQEGDVYVVFTDSDLVELIKISNQLEWKLGDKMGIISYDDTPLKEVLAGGITVISTDFKKMGATAAQFILNRIKRKTANPCKLIIRESL